jgi:hypothetical protein
MKTAIAADPEPENHPLRRHVWPGLPFCLQVSGSEKAMGWGDLPGWMQGLNLN